MGGVAEKDIALVLAQAVRSRLEQDALHVVITRQDDETRSFEDRAAIANGQANAIFISLHVGSIGSAGAVFTYYYDFNQLADLSAPAPAAGSELIPWDMAQRSSQGLSLRLAQLVQVELSARMPGSPDLPTGAAVFQLRSIDQPAVAIELASVNAADAATLEAFGAPLAEAISRAVRAFRTVYATESQ
jgi:N-acetylmuramoyl-L-alanine amidase